MKSRSALIKIAIYALSATAFFAMALVVLFVLIKGLGALEPVLLSPKGANGGVLLLGCAVNTLELILLSLAVSVPLGTATAAYVCEYSDRRFAKAVETAADTLSGVPSAVFGLFGMLCFSISLRLGYSLLSGAFTMAAMLLPVSIKSAIQGIRSVPLELREAARGLGAGKAALVFRVLLPCSRGCISSGAVLAAGRIAGETAALLYTAGTVSGIAAPTDSGRTLAVQLYCMASEGASLAGAYAVAAVLLILSAALSFTAYFIDSKRGGH